MDTCHPIPPPGRDAAEPARESRPGETRRTRILRGLVEDANVLACKLPRGNGRVLRGLVRRNLSRVRDHRSEDRFAAPLAAASVLIDERPVTVHDLSPSGIRARAEAGAACAIGMPVSVTFEGCERIAGRVAWIRDGQMGIRLPDNAIDLRRPATSPADSIRASVA